MVEIAFPVCKLLWTRSNPTIFHPLSLNIIREIHLYFPPSHLLIAIYSHSLVIYNPSTSKHWRFSLPSLLPSGSIFCLFDSVRAVGFYEVTVTLIDLVTTHVTSLPSLPTPRRSQSLISYQGYTYLFGGICNNTLTSSSMRLNIKQSVQWETLPDMQSEYCLSWPAVWQGEIYLFPKLTGSVIEVFTVATLSFRTINRKEYMGWKGIFAFSKDDDIVVLRGDGVLDKLYGLSTRVPVRNVTELACSPSISPGQITWLNREDSVVSSLHFHPLRLTSFPLDLK